MRKIRVHSPGVSNGRQYLGSGGGQLTCAMQDTLCSNISHLFLPDLTLSYAVGDLVTR